MYMCMLTYMYMYMYMYVHAYYPSLPRSSLAPSLKLCRTPEIPVTRGRRASMGRALLAHLAEGDAAGSGRAQDFSDVVVVIRFSRGFEAIQRALLLFEGC